MSKANTITIEHLEVKKSDIEKSKKVFRQYRMSLISKLLLFRERLTDARLMA